MWAGRLGASPLASSGALGAAAPAITSPITDSGSSPTGAGAAA